MSYRPIGRPKVVSDPLGRLPHINQYWQKIRALGPIAYWPLWDAAGASTAIDLMGLGDGTLGLTTAKPTMGVTGIGDGRTACSFDGGDYIDIYSAALNTAFNGGEGSLILCAKVDNWAAGDGNLFHIRVDDNNQIIITQTAVSGRLQFVYSAGGTTLTFNINSLSYTDYMDLAMIWSKVGDYYRIYINQAQPAAQQTGLGTWAGNLLSTACTIGARNTSSASGFIGDLAHVALFDYPLTTIPNP